MFYLRFYYIKCYLFAQVTRIYNEQYAPLQPANTPVMPETGPGRHVMRRLHAVQQNELHAYLDAPPLPWNDTDPLQYWKVSFVFV